MMKNIVVLLFMLLSSCSMSGDNFYKQNRYEDLYVLPLIKPYKLLSATKIPVCWQLDLNNTYRGSYKHTNVGRINVVGGVIFGHGMEEHCFPNLYFVVIPKDSVEKIFENKDEWVDYLSKRNINAEELRYASSVYQEFQADYNSLPWKP